MAIQLCLNINGFELTPPYDIWSLKLLAAISHYTIVVIMNFVCWTHLKLVFKKKCGRPRNKTKKKKKKALIEVWFVGRVVEVHRKFGDHWVEYKDPIDLRTVHQTWELVYVEKYCDIQNNLLLFYEKEKLYSTIIRIIQQNVCQYQSPMNSPS